MKVKSAMHSPVKCVELHTPVRAVARRMRVADVGAIPVQDYGALVGIITDRDVTCRAVADGADIVTLLARQVMSKDVVTCKAEEDIMAAVARMRSKKIRRLPVVGEANEVQGILSLGDVSHKIGKESSGEVLRSVSSHHP